MVYVRAPELTVEVDHLDGRFTAEIDVDDHGLVVTYEGLFRRSNL